MIWPVIFFSKVANALAKNGRFVALFVAFIAWATSLIDAIVNVVLTQIRDAILSIDVSAFQSVSIASLEWIGYANAILPVSEFVILLGLYVTAWLTVILIRWIKSFVPTIAN